MKSFRPLALFLIAVAINTIQAQPTREEKLAVEELIREAYVNGIYNKGIIRNIELGISEDFEAIGLLENGQNTITTYGDIIREVEQNQAAGKYPVEKAQEMVSVKYHRIEVEGKLANVKLNFMVGNQTRYVEYLALYKYPGGWKLINKTYREAALKE